jgi:hypothetical protein
MLVTLGHSDSNKSNKPSAQTGRMNPCAPMFASMVGQVEETTNTAAATGKVLCSGGGGEEHKKKLHSA